MSKVSLQKKWSIYIVECTDGSLYTGATPNISKRIELHNAGKGARYTRVHRPVKLVYTEQHSDRSSALKREAEIKKLSRQQKKTLIES